MDKFDLPYEEVITAWVKKDFGSKTGPEVLISLGVKVRSLELLFDQLNGVLSEVKTVVNEIDTMLKDSENA